MNKKNHLLLKLLVNKVFTYNIARASRQNNTSIGSDAIFFGVCCFNL